MSITKTQDNKLLKKWREKVLERDQYCSYCEKEGVLHCHHIYGRRMRSLRWDVSNGIMLCPFHHKLNSEFSAHETPRLFDEWFTSTYPERSAYLDEKARCAVPFRDTYEEVLERIENA